MTFPPETKVADLPAPMKSTVRVVKKAAAKKKKVRRKKKPQPKMRVRHNGVIYPNLKAALIANKKPFNEGYNAKVAKLRKHKRAIFYNLVFAAILPKKIKPAKVAP